MTVLNTKVLPNGHIEVRGNVGLRREWKEYQDNFGGLHVDTVAPHLNAAEKFKKAFGIAGPVLWYRKNPLDATGFCFAIADGAAK